MPPLEQPAAEVPLSGVGANVETCPSLLSQQAEPSAVIEYEGIETLLLAEHSPRLRPEQVRQCLIDCILELEHANVRTYLPVLIERVVDRHETSTSQCS